jgi:hypothetical protein
MGHIGTKSHGHGARAGCINATRPVQSIPQGLKPQILFAFCGTAKAVPFQNLIYAKGFSALSQQAFIYARSLTFPAASILID